MIRSVALTSLTSLFAIAYAQQAGTLVAETHPPLTWQTCNASGSCQNVAGSITLDADWRWLHETNSYGGCWGAGGWINPPCGPPNVCAQSCALEGADYSGTFGITTSGNALSLKYLTQGPSGPNVGSRVFLMASNTLYQTFKLKNREFRFDIDVSKVGCGVKSSLYFVGMDADGGIQKYPGNKAGAKYGTGYCDAKCPRNVRFINGEANTLNWYQVGPRWEGHVGSCCMEIDLWEGNSISNAFTHHPCQISEQYRCQDTECNEICDKDGCDFNSYRNGATTFYGPGRTVNSNNKFTVITQFHTVDGTDTGTLSEIRRLYVQNGVVIQNSQLQLPGIGSYNSITENYCYFQKIAFNDPDYFSQYGGFQVDSALDKGLVLAMSISDDPDTNMLPLDGQWPLDSTGPGTARGTCPTSLDYAETQAIQAANSVAFSNIKFGPINSY
ncbi:hypothetical protein FRC02_004499 [Tulasnella sp. 418]|nr:hypothetical protein FRC02_004499 [Tulasnella sp. 418]